MEGLELVIISAILCISGLVGVSIYLANARAVEQLRQDNLNYRAGIRASPSGYPPQQQEQEFGLNQILELVMKNPEILQKLGLGGAQSPSEEQKQQF